MILTTDQAVDHLRLDPDEADAAGDELTDVMAAAESAVLRYLKVAEADIVAGDLPVVVAAAKLMLGYLWRLRDEDEKGEFEPGFLPRPVTALLYPLRDPTLA